MRFLTAKGGTAFATLNITITGTNDAPVATLSTLAPFATTENAALTMTAALLANVTAGFEQVHLVGGATVTFDTIHYSAGITHLTDLGLSHIAAMA